ncbi:hypothetical protein D3C81_2124380 [compost metagenome]
MTLTLNENFLMAVNHNFCNGLILNQRLENIETPERVIHSANYLPLLCGGKTFDMLVTKHPAFNMLHQLTVAHTRSDI